MEALTRLVTESLARHGFNRPVDPRRLQWSRWFRCDSPHSLLVVPSKPGIFAIAEEIGGAADAVVRQSGNGGTAAPSAGSGQALGCPGSATDALLGGAALQRCDAEPTKRAALAAEVEPSKRMLAVLQFSEDDDMAFTLDRMFTKPNAMRQRLSSGRCFVRYVAIEDQDQRRNICAALNQWLISSAEKATGIPAGFSSSLEMASVERAPTPAPAPKPITMHPSMAHLDSGSRSNLHCPDPLPSGF